MQKNPLRYHAHLDTSTVEKMLQWFIQGSPASELAVQLGIRKATVLKWYHQFRTCLSTYIENQKTELSARSPWYLRLRRNQYPHGGGKLLRSIYMVVQWTIVWARCVQDPQWFTPLPTKWLREEVKSNYYVHHKKFIDELIPVASEAGMQKEADFLTIIPTPIHTFVAFSKEMIKCAHGIPPVYLHLHVAERVIRGMMKKNPRLMEEIIRGEQQGVL